MVGAGGALKYGDDAAFDYEKPNYCVCWMSGRTNDTAPTTFPTHE